VLLRLTDLIGHEGLGRKRVFEKKRRLKESSLTGGDPSAARRHLDVYDCSTKGEGGNAGKEESTILLVRGKSGRGSPCFFDKVLFVILK